MKVKIRKTGEVVDVITYSGHTYRSDIDVVSYVDSKGNECVDMKMNRFWDFEDVEESYLSAKESLIDWEERRFELIKAAMQGNLPTSVFDKETFCKYCISIADEMIANLTPNKKVMNKNIIIKKEKPICQLDGLPGVKRRKVDAYRINNTSDIEPTLELGYACTSAGDNGAINVWKDDAGIIRGELMRYCVTVEKRTFASYSEVEKCVSDWLERIN